MFIPLGVINITTHPSDQEAIIGGSVSLSCEASGGQFHQWLHSDQPVTSGGDYRITSTATGSTLEITSFKKELKGEYRCQFTSDDYIIVTHPGKVKCFGKFMCVCVHVHACIPVYMHVYHVSSADTSHNVPVTEVAIFVPVTVKLTVK